MICTIKHSAMGTPVKGASMTAVYQKRARMVQLNMLLHFGNKYQGFCLMELHNVAS
ncbi:hypothetical protein NXU92_22350 [Bacteroides fragilis]|nr:hypothetical protein [Bacteroides fragilis]